MVKGIFVRHQTESCNDSKFPLLSNGLVEIGFWSVQHCASKLSCFFHHQCEKFSPLPSYHLLLSNLKMLRSDEKKKKSTARKLPDISAAGVSSMIQNVWFNQVHPCGDKMAQCWYWVVVIKAIWSSRWASLYLLPSSRAVWKEGPCCVRGWPPLPRP